MEFSETFDFFSLSFVMIISPPPLWDMYGGTVFGYVVVCLATFYITIYKELYFGFLEIE